MIALPRAAPPTCSIAAEVVSVNSSMLARVPGPADFAAVAAAEAELGDSGRVLLQPSGTEPLVRVMVEASSEGVAREVAERLAGVVQG